MISFSDYLNEQMKDKEFKREYDALGPRYEAIKQLIQIRNELCMTQSDLAKKCGLLQSNISRLESGSYNPSLDLLQKIAAGLGKELHIEFR